MNYYKRSNKMRNFAEEVEQDFAYHKIDEAGQAECKAIRAAYRDLARNLSLRCDNGRDLALALTKLKESMHWAIGSVAKRYPVEQ
jgi:hypothetical protein